MTALLRPDEDPRQPGDLINGVPSEALLAVARLSTDAMVIAVERAGALVPIWTNPAMDRLVGRPPGFLIEAGFDGFGIEADAGEAGGRAHGELVRFLQDGVGGSREIGLTRADGKPVLANLTVAAIHAGGRPLSVLTFREIDERVWADQELLASEERFRVVAAHAPVGVFASEVGLRLGYVNERFAELWGRDSTDVVGTGWLDAVDPEDEQSFAAAICTVLGGAEIDAPVRIVHPDGAVRWVRFRATPVVLQGRGAGFVGSVEDITDDMRHEAELAHQATHDHLTGLPNRVRLADQIRDALAVQDRRDHPLALLFFDLDNFKLVNDSLGHVAGDQLLVEVARRLNASIRDGDSVARFGGDEFVVLCNGVTSADHALAVANRLLAEVVRPLMLGEQELAVTASVGVVVTADPLAEVESLVADADVAMYQAKQAGKNRCALFDEQVRSNLQNRLSLAGDLRKAIDNEDLAVAFQPVVDLVTGVLVGVEALLRWTHPVRGAVSPAELVAVAEDTGMIVTIGSWVLRRSCEQLAAWRVEYGEASPRYVAVNVSGHQLSLSDLPDIVEATLRETGLRGEDLCLELTESVLMVDVDGTLLTMNRLKALGVRLAIDDFGTGYSSLAYLKRFPVELLKVDRSFVSNLTGQGEDAAIVAAVVALAHALGLSVVAEGVEEAEQMAELHRLGCAFGQGYFLGRPVAALEVATRFFSRPDRDIPAAGTPDSRTTDTSTPDTSGPGPASHDTPHGKELPCPA